MSIERDVFWRSIASRSASSTITNWPLATSQPRTISSLSTSRSCTGHQRRFLIGVLHSACSWRKETSEARADGFVAGASPTGIVTRLKLIEPFQVVRMGNSNSRRETGSLPLSTLRADGRSEDDRRPVAERRGANVSSAAVPRRARRRLGGGLVAPRPRGASTPSRTACSPSGSKKGDAFAILASTSARVVPVRLRARPDRRDRRPGLREQLAARRRLRDRPLGVGRRPGRGRRAAGEDRGGARRPAAASGTFSPSRTCPSSRRADASTPPRTRRRSTDAEAAGRRGRPVHLHLHLGDDRPAQGLHDPPPQLLRDGGRAWTSCRAAVRRARRHAAPLPPARPQLRPPDPPPGALCRATRSPSAATRSASARRSPPSGRRSSRACRASTRRPHRGRRPGCDDARGPEARRSANGRSASAGRSAAAARPASRFPRCLARPRTGSPTGSSTRR